MRPKLVLCLALVLSGGLFGCSTAVQHPVASPCRKTTIHVPTTLNIKRTSNALSVSVNGETSLKRTNIVVEPDLVTGVEEDLFVYPLGQSRPSWPSRYGDIGALSFGSGISIFNTSQDGIPVVGKSYVVEMDIAVFETAPSNFEAVPHLAVMRTDTRFHVLWQGHIKQIVK